MTIKGKLIKKYTSDTFKKVLKSSLHRRIFWGVIFSVIIMFIIGTSVIPEQVSLQEGRPSPRDFNAPRNISYESKILTSVAEQEAADKVEPVYRNDEQVLLDIQEEINNYFSVIKNIRNNGEANLEEKVKMLESELGLSLEANVYSKLISENNSYIERLQNEATQIVRQYILPGVLPEDIEYTKRNIMGSITLLAIDDISKNFLSNLMENIEFKGNRIYDPITTAELKEKARDRVEPVVVEYSKEQKVIGKGEIITAEHLEALEKMGLLTYNNSSVPILGVILLVGIFFGAIVIYLFQYRKDILENESLFVLIGLLVISTLLVTKAVVAINIAGRAELSALVSYMVPIAAGSMLIAILFDGKLSIFITTLMSILIGIMNGIELQFALVAFVGGVAGIYSVSKLSQRSDLVKASAYIVGANVITIIALGLIQNYSLPILSVAILMGIINGVLSSILTIGTLPFWESAFGITTSVRLLELSNPNQPLLRRLLIEAPGTYHHSVVVGNLAEAAANAVGADALLTRVGANYHDIGKVKRPYFFIENQLTSENPHDKLSPTLSTLIITSHIKDGIELAKEHSLPNSIIDIIAQHHGNSIISFFYHKAKECSASEGCQEDDFRYDYPKPKTKEAAIVMLADSIEAGVRSMQKPTPNKIELFVKKVIKDKLEDGQLEDCDLTFKELDVISQAFTTVLNGIFHSRIEYPENVIQEMERGKNIGSIREQSTG